MDLPFQVVDPSGRRWHVIDTLVFMRRHGETEVARLLGVSQKSVKKYKNEVAEFFRHRRSLYHEMPGGRLALKERGYRKQRHNDEPEELRTYLQQHNLGYRTAARIAGINPETLRRAMKPKGEHGHRPISPLIFNGLMIRVEHSEVASEIELTYDTVLRKHSRTREDLQGLARYCKERQAFQEESERRVRRACALVDCFARMEVESPAF